MKGVLFDQLNTTNFETRRINFTFRYVPTEHVRLFAKLPGPLQSDVRAYVDELARGSKFWNGYSEP